MGKLLLVWWLAGCATGEAEPLDVARVEVRDAGRADSAIVRGPIDASLPDAIVTETNVCEPGTSQPCGDATFAGVGVCTRGTQGCEGGGEFGTWSRCVGEVGPSEDLCLDGIDQDCNGVADDGPRCTCAPGETRSCFTGPAEVGICRAGMQACVATGGLLAWGDCLDEVLPRAEICGNGLDDDCNGAVDDAPGCECTTGASRACYAGPMSEIGVGVCRAGTQMCLAGGHWGECAGDVGPSVEVCGNGIDDDCNGAIDEGCPTIIDVPVDIMGDCVTASCPAEAPYPVCCNITLYGGDPRGCVAANPLSPVVYFQEGDACGAGWVQGTLRCSSEPGLPLTQLSCPINKSTAYHPLARSGCPRTSG